MCNTCPADAKCQNLVSQWVPKGYDYTEVQLKCGSTGIHGDELICGECRAKFERPWYICKHGRDVSEYDCPTCEAESWEDDE